MHFLVCEDSGQPLVSTKFDESLRRSLNKLLKKNTLVGQNIVDRKSSETIPKIAYAMVKGVFRIFIFQLL